MIVTKFKPSIFVLTGIVIGCGAAVTAPETFTPNSASASDPGGSWACYRANDFDNKDYGRGEDDAKKAETGMNQIAPDAERGRIVTLPTQLAMGDLQGVVCVKH